jgi:NADH-quinone oxidoreductase subunit G
MPKLTINGQSVEVEQGLTILQAAQLMGIEIPVFCYHPRLAVAGNCRMCLVEVEKAPKPVASCAMPAAEGMVVHTKSPLVDNARQGVLEFLLINHPLDCPICDQGGECDLQDITMMYGGDRGRFHENKRAVADKNLGPLIKTVMTRCIHCTRCIRFATEIAGVPELGALGRGEHMEVGTYVGKAVSSELSGNMIDICPVGALTSKPYAFTGRPWELQKTPSIDVMDGVGSAIRIDARGQKVMRILPRVNPEINEEWISDKTRFACDGLEYQRLDQPYVRVGKTLKPTSWDEAFSLIKDQIGKVSGGAEIGALTGDLVEAESLVVLRDLMEGLGVGAVDCRQDGAFADPAFRASYLFNTTIEGIEQAEGCLLIGSNPRWEAPLINARLRKRWAHLYGHFPVGVIGPSLDLTYPVDHLGNSPTLLQDILAGKSPFSETLKGIQERQGKSMLILGGGALTHQEAPTIFALAQEIAEQYGMIQEGWNGFNVLQSTASRVAGLDLGLIPSAMTHGKKGPQSTEEILKSCREGKIKVLYVLGADEIDLSSLGDTFIIYQGHHGDHGAHHAHVILPGAAYTEKNGTYVNTEGRVQRAYPSISPPGEAKEDWKILRALAEVLSIPLPFVSLEDVRERMIQMNPLFREVDQITPPSWKKSGKGGAVSSKAFQLPIDNFYMTNVISRHSPTMARCVQEFYQGGILPQQETHL